MKTYVHNRNVRLLWRKISVIGIVLFANSWGNILSAQEIVNPAHGMEEVCSEKIIRGKTNLEQLEQIPDFWIEYLNHYANYAIDREKLTEIAQELNNKSIKIVVVIGSWCGDSKEQLPVFQKIFDNLLQNKPDIEYIGVDRDKIAQDLDISSLNVNFIPVFIFYENDQEIGRITETPSSTMEDDIIRILKKEK